MRDGALRKIPLSLLDDPRGPLRSVVDSAGLEELMDSMSRRGLLQPIGVVPREGRFEVVWGHRRTLAARELRWEEITARVVQRDESGLLLDRAHENLIRQDLSPVEEAELCRALLAEAGGDIERASRSVGRSVGWVEARLDLLSWPEDVRTAVDGGQLSRAAGRPLASIKDEEERAFLLRHAIADGASERVTRAWLQAYELKGHIADPGLIAPAPGRSVVPLPDPTHPCFFCGQRDALGRMQYYWLHPVCAEVIASHRPGEELDGAELVGEVVGRAPGA